MKNNIIDMMKELHLTSCLKAYENLRLNLKYSSLSHEEILEALLNSELESRHNNTINKRIKAAKFSISNASLSDIDYDPDRKINKAVIDTLASNEYISYIRNVLIFGATGTGKTYIANALGINAAKAKYRVRFYRMSELLNELITYKIQGELFKFTSKASSFNLIIIDDFLLTPISNEEQSSLMELFEYVSRSSSIIITSQLSKEEWHSRLGGGIVADAILDRLTPKAYELIIDGDSLRGRK